MRPKGRGASARLGVQPCHDFSDATGSQRSSAAGGDRARDTTGDGRAQNPSVRLRSRITRTEFYQWKWFIHTKTADNSSRHNFTTCIIEGNVSATTRCSLA